jgi:hypothetical protein
MNLTSNGVADAASNSLGGSAHRGAADKPYAELDTQRVGRMGELIVEFELLKRGWIVGNFNHSTLNSAGWDLFATRGKRSVKIRCKAKRPGIACFRWSARADGSVFLGLEETDDDFVAAVSFTPDGSYEAFVMPSAMVQRTLRDEHERWLGGTKTGGGARKPTTMRHIYIDERDDGAPAHGFAQRWAPYRNAWETLDGLSD